MHDAQSNARLGAFRDRRVLERISERHPGYRCCMAYTFAIAVFALVDAAVGAYDVALAAGFVAPL